MDLIFALYCTLCAFGEALQQLSYLLNNLIKCLLYFNTGPPGKPGPKGSTGPRGPEGKSGGVTGGAVYTRWGRKACPKTAQTTQLYSGKKVEKNIHVNIAIKMVILLVLLNHSMWNRY